MSFKARLSIKFYIICALLLCLVVFVWYGIYFLNANEILMEDDSPMDSGTKAVFTAVMSIIAISWTVSLFTLIRQMIIGAAFVMDEGGINATATAVMALAFIFVVPVKRIPYDAIKQVSQEHGILSIKLDRSKVEAPPVFRLFVRSEYHFFAGFTKEDQGRIQTALNKYVRTSDYQAKANDNS